jgi:hypothetical protein
MGLIMPRVQTRTSNHALCDFSAQDSTMNVFPPFVTARELLSQVAEALLLKSEESRLGQPCDCEYMRLLTDATNPYPFHLVNGADYLSWVGKYAFYYSIGLGMTTAFVCVESKPITNLLALISLQSGIPQSDLFSLCVCRQHFEALNRGLEQVWAANPIFFEQRSPDLDALIALIKRLKKESVDVVVLDALHQVRFDLKRPATRAEQRLFSSALQSTAHVGQFHIVSGFYDPYVPFPNLPADTVFYCDSGQPESTKAKPRRIAIAALAMASIRWIRAVCMSLFRSKM